MTPRDEAVAALAEALNVYEGGPMALELAKANAAAILDALTPAGKAALAAWLVPAEPVRDKDGIAGVVEYDFEERWLVHTEPLGASEIVARDVPSWFGGLVTARLHPRPLPIRVVFPKEPAR
jgi:hypothetical protein